MEIFQNIILPENNSEFFKTNIERRISAGIMKESILSELLKPGRYSQNNMRVFYSLRYSLSILNRNTRYDEFLIEGFKIDKAVLFENMCLSDFPSKPADFSLLKIFLTDFHYIPNFRSDQRIYKYLEKIEEKYDIFLALKDIANCSKFKLLALKAMAVIWGC